MEGNESEEGINERDKKRWNNKENLWRRGKERKMCICWRKYGKKGYRWIWIRKEKGKEDYGWRRMGKDKRKKEDKNNEILKLEDSWKCDGRDEGNDGKGRNKNS